MYVEIGPAWNRNRGGAARKAAVDAARGFESDILLIANGISSNAKDSAAIAALQVHGGASAQVLATGPEEEAAPQALLPLMQARRLPHHPAARAPAHTRPHAHLSL
ncbi:HPr family phosphocarrier protein [Burkholderia cepacia]|nr:HPr family phosphocarrier protein [Burkholderia cepacia]